MIISAPGEKDVDTAINEMRQAAVVDAQFKNVEALVNLGMLYIKNNIDILNERLVSLGKPPMVMMERSRCSSVCSWDFGRVRS